MTEDELREIILSPMVSVTETSEAIALRFEVTRARREEETLRLALATATRERDEAQNTAAFLLELLHAAVRTGTKDPFLDARLTEELRSHE